MDRENTNFSLKVIAKLKEKYEDYKKDNDLQSLLKYYQFIPQFLMESVNSKGVLVFASPGLGKTRIAVNIASKYKNTIVLEPQSLHNNFRGEIDKFKAISGKKIDVTFVSSNAFNAADQFENFNLKNSLLIIDEAHIFFKAIINSGNQTNARRIYDIIMATPSVKLLFLTGTPCSKDIFELVPCFNMLAGYDLFPTQYETFYRLYVSEGHFINREKFQNRILGLVSHVDSTKPTDFTTVTRTAGDDGYFPVDLGLDVIRVEMSEPQYHQYLLFRQTEHKDNSKPTRQITKALSIPNSNNSKTYYVKSRMCSNFLTPPFCTNVQELSNEAFLVENSPKLHKIAEMMDKCEGKAIAYSQFVNNGLVPLARYLELLGYELYGDSIVAKEDAEDEEIEEIAVEKPDEHIESSEQANINSIIVGGDEDELPADDSKLLRKNTIANSQSEFKDKLPPIDVFDTKDKKKSKKIIKFAHHLCLNDAYVEKYFNGREKDAVKKIIDTRQKIENFIYYDPKIKNSIISRFPGQTEKDDRCLFIQIIRLFVETIKPDTVATVIWNGEKSPLENELLKLYPGIKITYLTSLDDYSGEIPDFIISPNYEFTDLSNVDAKASTFDRSTELRPKIASLVHISIMPNKKFRPGKLMMNVWMSQSNDSAMLFSLAEDYDGEKMEINTDHYVDFCAYHNLIVRQWMSFETGAFDNCYDCANEYNLWLDYCDGNEEVAKMHLANLENLHNYMSQRAILPKNGRGYNNLPKSAITGGGKLVKAGNVPKKSSYIMITGAMSQDERRRLLQIFNSDIDGSNIKFILMSEVGATGLDLKCVMETYQIEPYWEATRMKQFRFRALRMGSHDALPREKRHVKSYIFLSTAHKLTHDQMIEKEDKTIDEIFYDRSIYRYVLNQEAESVLSGASIECTLFGYGDCRICAATNEKLFSRNAMRDIELPDPCKTCDDKNIAVEKIELNGKTYYYKKNPEELLGYDFYEYNEEYSGYIPCLANNPDLYELVEKLKSL